MVRMAWARLGVLFPAAAAAAVLAGGCAESEAPGGLGGGPIGTPQAPSSTSAASGSGSDFTASACPHTTDRFSLQITTPQGAPGAESPQAVTYGCGQATGTVALSGMVTSVAGTSIEVLPCATEDACEEGPTSIAFSAPDLSPLPFLGAFVRVEALFQADCAQTLLITNLPTFDGWANPVNSEPILWLAGADGTLSTADHAPFGIGAAPGCTVQGASFTDSKLSFTFPGFAGAPETVDLSMGLFYAASLGDGESWVVHNLRSFRSAGVPLGSLRDFAYWVSYVPSDLQ